MVIKCPTCGSYQIFNHYQLHVGRWGNDGKICYLDDGGEKWTTKKFREQNNLKPDSSQILVVPPIDITWNYCKMCHTEFDENGKIYR